MSFSLNIYPLKPNLPPSFRHFNSYVTLWYGCPFIWLDFPLTFLTSVLLYGLHIFCMGFTVFWFSTLFDDYLLNERQTRYGSLSHISYLFEFYLSRFLRKTFFLNMVKMLWKWYLPNGSRTIGCVLSNIVHLIEIYKKVYRTPYWPFQGTYKP